jgi:hypothetical protein
MAMPQTVLGAKYYVAAIAAVRAGAFAEAI